MNYTWTLYNWYGNEVSTNYTWTVCTYSVTTGIVLAATTACTLLVVLSRGYEIW